MMKGREKEIFDGLFCPIYFSNPGDVVSRYSGENSDASLPPGHLHRALLARCVCVCVLVYVCVLCVCVCV